VNGNGDAFWGDDPSVLFQKDRLIEFFPTGDQTLTERVNAVTRLIIYVALALSIYQGRATASHFSLVLLAMIYFMYRNQTIVKLSTMESFTAVPAKKKVEACVMPTPQNPYMNFLLGDVPGRPPACKGPGVEETASVMLDNQLFSDVDDVFSRNANQRLFRTMPETTGIPNYERFANWLIKNEGGCKTTGMCAPWEDLRQQRQLIPEDLNQPYTVSGFSF